MKLSLKESVVDLESIECGDLLCVKGKYAKSIFKRFIVSGAIGVMAVDLADGQAGLCKDTLSEIIDYYTTDGYNIVRVIKSEDLELKEI